MYSITFFLRLFLTNFTSYVMIVKNIQERIGIMKRAKRIIFGIFKLLVVVLAVGNLAALFLFDYKIPDFLKSLEKEAAEESEVSEQEEAGPGYSIQMDSDTLTYNGTGTLDLLKGVSLVASDGTVSDADIFAHIKTGDSVSQKIINYTADTDQGQVTASRTLKLQNYNGPSIQLPDTLPQVEDEQLDSIMTIMPSDGSFRADDGYGNDITGAVTASYTIDENDSSVVHYVFTVTNSYNDTVSAAADLSLTRTKPVITLKEYAVTIPLNSSFSALSYVATAEDVDGSSLFTRIQIQGTVNTAQAGDYILTYFVTSPSGVTSATKELKVTVH